MKALSLLLVVSLCAVGTLAISPSQTAINALAHNLRELWGERRLNESTALYIAENQLQYILDNKNDSLVFRELEPMLVECPALAPRKAPSSVTQLHPQDVKIVAALGDSVSTGCNSLSSSWLNMKDYQGISWAIGGDAGITTMPNLVGQFASSLTGQSRGVGDGNTGFNFAKNGAIIQDMPAQATALVKALKSSVNIDYNNDWKVVTILMGGNNLCDVCDSGKEQDNNAATYEKHLRQTLTTLSALPRTFVNLVSHLDYTQIAKFKGPLCSLALPFVCDCLTAGDSAKQARARDEIVRYNAVHDKIAGEFRRDDFAVVVQKALIKSVIPDKSYISAADCFHPSGEGQRLFATALWNSMIIPAKQKASYVATVNDEPNCANADTLLYVD